MSLSKITSPHGHAAQSTSRIMLQVILAAVPGVVALTIAFGWGTFTNIVLAVFFALSFEAIILKLRTRPIGFYLKDYSALVSALLLGIALPPYSPWWLIAVGIFFAIVLAKHLYGGMGYNPFNPAMVGYVVLLISFPVEMTRWAAPLSLLGELQQPGFIDSFKITLNISNYPPMDGFTLATPLDLIRQNNSLMVSDLKESYQQFGHWSGIGWQSVNVAFLVGGLFLLYQRVYTWHAPVSMLITLALFSALFYDSGSSQSLGSPLFQLFSGATMFGAWFIVTDPVTSAVSNKGRVIYGACIGALIFLIRKWGNYPDAVAFAVLLMNFAAPLLDHYTQPKTYGHP